MARSDQWVYFRWIFVLLVLGPPVLAPWVGSYWPGFFWDYVGGTIVLSVTLLCISVYAFGFMSIVEPPSMVEEDLEEEEDSRPPTVGYGELTAAQFVAATDSVDRNQPPAGSGSNRDA